MPALLLMMLIGFHDAANVPEEPKAEGRFRIDESRIDTIVWQEAIRQTTVHQNRFGPGRGYYSLLHIVAEDAAPALQIQVEAHKHVKFGEEYDGGGGTFRSYASGDFVLINHVNYDKYEPVVLGTLRHGRSKLWIKLPKPGQLNVIGDVVLKPCPEEEVGRLNLKLNAARGRNLAHLVIDPVVVGGPYGQTYKFEASKEAELRLPSGDYKILLPDFDYKNSRWTISVQPNRTTRLSFDGKAQLRGVTVGP